MVILHSFEEAQALGMPFAMTIGNFDGVHVGHRSLISRVCEVAKQKKVSSLLMTFDPHPLKVLQPDRPLHRIFPSVTQRKIAADLGIDYYLEVPFTKDFSTLSPEFFLEQYIFRKLNPKAILVGYDFGFGAQRQGSLALLQKQAQHLNCEVEVIPPFHVDDQIVSSTKIREFIKRGEVAQAMHFLGQPFFIEGIVVKGDQRGRTIGFPTANLSTDWILKPRVGVYRTWTQVGGKKYYSMTNVGHNPTVVDYLPQVKVETHLFDFNEIIYGEKIKISFLDYIREEKKFSSIDELKNQLQQDQKQIRNIFNEKDKIL